MCRKSSLRVNFYQPSPDGCEEGVIDGRDEGTVVGLTVQAQGLVFEGGDVSLILSKNQILYT